MAHRLGTDPMIVTLGANMSITRVGYSENFYQSSTENGAKNQSSQAKLATSVSTAPEPQESTVVTLSNGHNTNVINGDVSSLSAMPLTVAWAPQLFVQADANRDNQLTVGEFTDQLSRIGETADTAKALFSKFDTDDDGKLSIDEFVQGVQSNVATGGGALFSRLIDSYTVNPNDKDDKQPLNNFLAAGLAVANAYWSKTQTSSA